MDTDQQLADLTFWSAQMLVYRPSRETAEPLAFRMQQTGLWNAQGAADWGPISRAKHRRT